MFPPHVAVSLPCYDAAASVTSTVLRETLESSCALRGSLSCENKCCCIELDMWFIFKLKLIFFLISEFQTLVLFHSVIHLHYLILKIQWFVTLSCFFIFSFLLFLKNRIISFLSRSLLALNNNPPTPCGKTLNDLQCKIDFSWRQCTLYKLQGCYPPHDHPVTHHSSTCPSGLALSLLLDFYFPVWRLLNHIACTGVLLHTSTSLLSSCHCGNKIAEGDVLRPYLWRLDNSIWLIKGIFVLRSYLEGQCRWRNAAFV